jgi:S-(hydroxymethyl)glutathione dehydrogenase/alcohol dehydrogenase
MPLDVASVLACAVMTGVGAVLNTAAVEPGSTVVVLGAGGVGLNCIQGCVLAGAGQIIATDRVAAKLEAARSFAARPQQDIPKLVEFYRAGRLRLDDLISGRFELDRINGAIGSARAGEQLRSVIVFPS